eukprot:TRINITY_DN1410_c0_g1_i1.p1 TRINITY_DN1410_c0_g1~~TRINITY_DN1410_c0_g1_i1.p1  ORF type:complete len:655 (+),score=296.42 TRINITY_DN1410_c0_g1_i1:53-1966(+)
MKAAVVLVLLGACAVPSAAGSVEGPMLVASQVGFNSWMAAGGEGLSGEESLPEFRLKFIKRVTAWLQQQLQDVPSIYRVMSYFGAAGGLDVGELSSDLKKMSGADSTAEFVKTAHAAAEKMDARLRKENGNVGADEYPYYNWIPEPKGNVLPGGAPLEWSNRNCKKNKATATWNADRESVELVVEASECDLLHVGDFYLLATTEGVHTMKMTDISRKATITWKLHEPNNTAVVYDFTKKGIRVMAFVHDEVVTLKNLLATAELFLQPDVGRYPVKPDEKVQAKNVDFLTKYTNVKPVMTKRANPSLLDVDTDLIGSGDFVGVIRLDGLDPMLAWAMGSTTGHTTVAMRNASNDLHICESTGKTDYWDVNGVQCTPYATWMERAAAAGFNVVWAPLAPAQRAKLNTTAMWDFFHTVEGLDYGFENMLWGWIDTTNQNYPCVAPDYTMCLRWEHVELLFTVGHRLVPSVTDRLVVPSWNLRMGTTGLSPDEILMHAETVKNMTTAELPAMVEQDTWRYNTTRYGKPAVGRAMVCCVFVCNMWKAGGLFGNDDINCAELSNIDDYSLNIFDPALANENRPEVCKQADPDNQLCQMLGEYTLNFNHFNTSNFYSHMDERCPTWAPGVGPDYWPEGKQQGTC